MPRNTARRHEEYCSVARALEVVGDRWSLLLVQDLLFAPKRYSDLVAGLAGISTNLLAARLKRLERAGVVGKRRLPPPSAATVYELTDRGRLLEPVLYALSPFGISFLGPPPRDLALRPERWFFALRSAFRPDRARGVAESYELRLDGDGPVHVDVRDGRLDAGPGPAADPAVVITATTLVLLGLAARRVSPTRALADRAVKLEGSRAAFSRFVRMLELPAPAGVD